MELLFNWQLLFFKYEGTLHGLPNRLIRAKTPEGQAQDPVGEALSSLAGSSTL